MTWLKLPFPEIVTCLLSGDKNPNELCESLIIIRYSS